MILLTQIFLRGKSKEVLSLIQMEESKKLYKDFEGKKVRIITKSGFSYNTNSLQVYENCLKFVDRLGQQVLLDFSEIKFITEVQNGH